jgi:hypothetical protein
MVPAYMAHPTAQLWHFSKFTSLTKTFHERLRTSIQQKCSVLQPNDLLG